MGRRAIARRSCAFPSYRPEREAACRVELRSPDPAANPYLAFAVMLAAGLQAASRTELELQPPTEDQDLFCLSRQDLRRAGHQARCRRAWGRRWSCSRRPSLMRETLGEHIHAYLVSAKARRLERLPGFRDASGSATATWGCCSMAWANGVRREPSQAAICGMRETSQAAICGMRDVEGGDQRKTVIFIADSLDNAHKFQQVLSGLDVDVAAGSSMQFRKLLAQHPNCDLVVYEARGDALSRCGAGRAAAGGATDRHRCWSSSSEDQLGEFRLPVQVKADFVVHRRQRGRMRRAHPPASVAGQRGVVVRLYLAVDNLTINLATYQVKVGGEPLDLTYLEYALLAFLVTHPGRTYSRDALLRRVWGFDYYGGSRTVDVHVRRVRAKLGPDLAQHLETVRGVGYLWSA